VEEFEDILNEIAIRKWQETERTPAEIVDRFKLKGKMTSEEILMLKPGRELNILVAKYVMGHEVVSDETFGDMERLIDDDGSSVWNVLRPYSGDRSAAQAVVTGMIKLGYADAESWADFGDGIYTPPEATCKRALLMILEQEG